MNGFFQFLTPNQDLSVAYLGTYNVALVSLSLLTAIFASFMAFELSGRIAHAHNATGKIVWLAPGALAMGGGVWAMHFIGMLAFSLPCGISYDPFITLISMIPGILASAVALWAIGQTRITHKVLVMGGVLMGGGVGLMHYSGMAAMRLDAVIYFSPTLFAVSIAFAIVLAILSLYARFILRHQLPGLPGWGVSLLGAILMGLAISGMHYIAMEAAYFIPVGKNTATAPGVSPTVLALGIGTVTLLLIALVLTASVLGKHLESIEILEHEISERKRLTADLEFQKFALDEHAIVSITDVKGDITYANNKFCRISGYSREELLGCNHRMLKSEEHSPEFFEELWRTIANGNSWHGEIKNLRKDGGIYWVKATIVPVLNAEGKPFQYVAIRTDITERKEAEHIAEDAREEAERANKAKSQFLANMSHELRTPLNAILGFSDMMKGQAFGPLGSDKYIEYANDIHSSGSHLLSLVNDILHMSKIESGNHSLNMESVDALKFVRECLAIVKGLAKDKDISLVNNIANDPPPLFADTRAIKQCLINLLSNAVKFTPEKGTVTISTSTSPQWYNLTVSDTGIGVAREDINKLTQPFTQIERMKTARIHEGTGIGLTITRNLIEMHGGTLEIDSELNVGTKVTIHLPRS